ncbi:MAG: SMP-30/gluconolactonase/LRE family protein [Actinomycetota bacterium]|nr:SMP-30/gluconolactonase/LRE family protein [Actinomycetota bacterium]
MISQTDGKGQTTEYIRNVLGQPVETIDPLKRKTIRAYDDAGNLVGKTDPEGRKTTYAYDAANRLEEVSHSSGNPAPVEFSYDDNGNVLTMVDGTGTSSYDYDELGRLVEAKDGHGSTVLYAYDLADRQTGITYPNGKTVVNAFDDAGRMESVTDWLGNTTSFGYDRNSNLGKITFPAGTGNVDEFGYDRADEMIAVAMKKGSETLASLGYTREKVGQVASLTSSGLPGAEAESFTYDENDRLIKAGPSSYGYNAADNLTKAPGTSFGYDAANQLTAGTGRTYAFDKLGERTKETRSIAPAFSSQFGSLGSGNGQLSNPSGVAVKGGIWVADTGNHRIQKFTEGGAYVSQFGSLGTKKGQLSSPRALAFTAAGQLWVADTGNNRIQKFTEAGESLTQVGKEGTSAGQFKSPSGIAVGSSGNVWVADTGNNRIQEFSAAGVFVRQFGTAGSGNGQLKSPAGVAVASNGHVWVADKENNRIQEFSAEGTYLSQFGSSGSGDGQLKNPTGVAVGSNGTIWVADTGNHRVQVFSAAGEYITQFGKEGTGSGQLKSPAALGLGSNSEIWLADSGNNRIQKWLDSNLVTNYSYDQAGNLTSVQRAKVGEVPAVNETYAYDGMGRRASQTVSGTTRYLSWNTTRGLPLLLDDGEYSYVYGPGGLPVEQISSAGTPSYYHHDQLGSTRMLTGAGGSPTATFTFDAYGNLAGSTGAQRAPLGYAGQYTNEQSGLQYLRARVYDPASGQFLTRDPLGVQTGMAYAYANGSPLTWTDPSGQLGWDDVKSVGSSVWNSDLNPLLPYQEEIECLQDGTCSYWEAVGKGLQGACTFIPFGGGAGRAARGIKSFADDAASAGARREAANLTEQLAMKSAKSDPAGGTTIIKELGNPKYPSSEGWVKKAQNINGVEIHYFYNEKTGVAEGWKYKD